jgi:hypothetical protein
MTLKETRMHTLKFMALSMLTLAVGLAADHPITIAGGSPITMEHDNWYRINDHNLGSNIKDIATKVVIASEASTTPTTIPLDGEKLKLTFGYGTDKLTVKANHKNGKEVVVTTKKSLANDFQQNNHQYVRDEPGASITNVAVQKGTASPTPVPVSGHTKITICYGAPDGSSVAECK